MKNFKNMKLGITQKLLILFSFFVLIFYGTLLVLFTNTQKIMGISEQIVGKNNQISALSKVVYESLLSMEVNDKKYRLLNKDIYKQYFEESQINFETNLTNILGLESQNYSVPGVWKNLSKSYHDHLVSLGNPDDLYNAEIEEWAPEDKIDDWLDDISEARIDNERAILISLLDINTKGKQSVRNGMIGMGITIVAGFIAAFFLSSSIIKPLKVLTHALKNVSTEKDSEKIHIKSKDEFGELATAFNDMSSQLKEEEELRSEFIATLSHEIRTPLSSIRESVNMILEGVLGNIGEKQRKFLDIAKSEITRIGDLLDHLLHESHLDSDSRKVMPTIIDPNKLVLEVSRGLIPTAKAKSVSMKLHKMANPPVIIGVKKELQQVLFNLLENAVKFSPRSGEVEIRLSLNERRDMLTYRVSDQGPGIPEQEQSLIFSKYYRAKKARSHMSGVGLGLSISKRIIKFHGGEIFVKNNEGAGCSFYCSLPCENDESNGIVAS